MTKNTPLKATGAHVSIITHVTASDLQMYLGDVSTKNGFANRFCFFFVQRVCSLADPGRPPESDLRNFATKLTAAIEFGERVKEMKRSPEAVSIWKPLYEKLNTPRVGRRHNDVCARSAPQVVRLSMIYALLDHSTVIEPCHIASALALWNYCESTSRFVFGDSVGDKLAEKILELLKTKPEGMITREITHKIGNKKGISDALRLLVENGLVRVESLKDTSAHRGQRWFAT